MLGTARVPADRYVSARLVTVATQYSHGNMTMPKMAYTLQMFSHAHDGMTIFMGRPYTPATAAQPGTGQESASRDRDEPTHMHCKQSGAATPHTGQQSAEHREAEACDGHPTSGPKQ
jgi:hypothetical protein